MAVIEQFKCPHIPSLNRRHQRFIACLFECHSVQRSSREYLRNGKSSGSLGDNAHKYAMLVAGVGLKSVDSMRPYEALQPAVGLGPGYRRCLGYRLRNLE